MAFRAIITEEATDCLLSMYGIRVPIGEDTSVYGLGGVIVRHAKGQRIRILDIEEAVRQAMHRGSYHEKLINEIEPIDHVEDTLSNTADGSNEEAEQLIFPFLVERPPTLVYHDSYLFLNPDGRPKRRKKK